jgi:hypothetical protein
MSMTFTSQAYLDSLSVEERQKVFRSHASLGFHPTTRDELLVSERDRYAGMYILGVQGVGKSGLLENMIAQDAAAGRAIIVVDAHGDLTRNCLQEPPLQRVAQTYVLDLLDEGWPIGVNQFARTKLTTEVERAQAIERVMHVFEALWPEVLSHQHLPRYVRAATIVFLANPGATLVDMYAFLLDERLRRRMLQNVTDHTVRTFWETQYENLSDVEKHRRVLPLLGRLETLFMGRSLVRNVVGQRATTINFRKAIENREIVFIPLPIKQLGEVAQLVGTILISQLHAALFSFADIPEANRPGVSLFIDEFQHFVTRNIDSLFTEGRKFGMRLTVGHQYRGQLDEAPYLKDSTMTARTKVCFQLTLADSRELAGLFQSAGQETRPQDIETHPTKVLLERGSDDPQVRTFIEIYLRPLLSYKRGNKVDIEDRQFVIDLIHGSRFKDLYVADPTPYLDNLLYEVMRTGNANLDIPIDAVLGFANCGRKFFSAARNMKGARELTAQVAYPAYLMTDAAALYHRVMRLSRMRCRPGVFCRLIVRDERYALNQPGFVHLSRASSSQGLRDGLWRGVRTDMSETLSVAVGVLQALANIGILITIAFLAVQTHASTKTAEEARLLRVADIFRSVNLQYDDIISELPPEINEKDPTTGKPTTDLASLRTYADQPGFSPGRAVKAIWRYYYMTRAEYELCRMGIPTDEIWSGWLSGILASFHIPAFQETWKQMAENERPDRPMAHIGYYDFMELARTNPELLRRECSTVQGLIEWANRFSSAAIPVSAAKYVRS